MNATSDSPPHDWINIVRRKVEAMRFGSVQIIVHEGRVTQVESTEKTRLPGDSPTQNAGRHPSL